MEVDKNTNNKKFDFNNLFIFDLANNHQGLVEHGLNIIRGMSNIAHKHNIRAGVKFQFRDIDTLIHPHHKKNSDNKHIPRFIATRLKAEEYQILLNEITQSGLLSICTPFDESSVELIEQLGIEVIKIGSCSAQDWPLLERIVSTGKPVICSTGGLKLTEIDKVVSFFQHRGVDFALEYCVSIYPTPNNKFHLNQIAVMRNRYPGITIGFSTHEEPSNLLVVGLAYAKGARIFEKHVGIETDKIKLNKYSANPEQTEEWVKALKNTIDICGSTTEHKVSEEEKNDLKSLQRGVYVKEKVNKGEEIKPEIVYFAMPFLEGQLSSGKWKSGLVADRDYNVDEPLSQELRPDIKTKKDVVYSTIHMVKGMINNALIPLSHDFYVEISHHYGLDNFQQVGCVIIECINHREYAKKLVVQLPGQEHPAHFHKKKDETFQLLHGDLEVEIEGKKKFLTPGDTIWVPRGVWHGFRTNDGAIFEEVSTRSYEDDSFYVDKLISKMSREERKTNLHNWGRHQFE